MRGDLDLLDEFHRRDERALETLRAARGPEAPVYLIELGAAEETRASERLEAVRNALTARPLGDQRHALWWGSRALPLLRSAVELGYTFSGEDERRYWEPLGETLRVGVVSELWRDGLAELFERHAEQTRVRAGSSPWKDVEDSRHHTRCVGAFRGQMRRQIPVDDLLEAEPVDRADDEKVSDGENMVLKGVEAHRA